MREGRNLEPGRVWWEEIAGPASLIMDIKGSLDIGKCVVCNVSSVLSFRWTFRDTIDHWLGNYGVTVEHIDCNEEYTGGDITEFLLREMNSTHLTEYCRRPRPQYMRDNNILRNKLLWIRGVEAKYVADWCRYVAAYRSTGIENGLMILEIYDEPGIRLAENLNYFRYQDYVRSDDIRLYASILSSSSGALSDNLNMKEYAIELVSSLSMYDAELISDLLGRSNLLDNDPLEVLKQEIEESYQNSPRGRAEWHPIALLRHNDKKSLDALNHRIWVAQIRVGYPLIELERKEIIKKWYDEVLLALKTERPKHEKHRHYEDFEGNQITDPRYVEVGTLSLIAFRQGLYQQDLSRYCINDRSTRTRITFLRKCRNFLAHMDVCTPDMMKDLLAP